MRQERQTDLSEDEPAPVRPLISHPAALLPVVVRSEPELQAAVVARLEAHGIALGAHVICAAGTPDIVTADGSVIYEVKHQLTRKALFMAVGQVLLYRQALNVDARAVIIGHATRETPALVPLIEALGIEVVMWREEGWGRRDEAACLSGAPMMAGEPATAHAHDRRRLGFPGETQASSEDLAVHLPPTSGFQAPTAQSPVTSARLHWNVAPLAQAQSIPNASALGLHLGVHRQGLYGIWNGTARQVSIEILEKLAHHLGADPGEWFVWRSGDWAIGTSAQSPGVNPQLRWNVAAAAQMRGVDVNELCFRAQLYMSSLGPIWGGTAQAVSPATLGKIARALGQVGPSFPIGTLFTWQDVQLIPTSTLARDDTEREK